jgi:hypothetical protein
VVLAVALIQQLLELQELMAVMEFLVVAVAVLLLLVQQLVPLEAMAAQV